MQSAASAYMLVDSFLDASCWVREADLGQPCWEEAQWNQIGREGGREGVQQEAHGAPETPVSFRPLSPEQPHYCARSRVNDCSQHPIEQKNCPARLCLNSPPTSLQVSERVIAAFND